MKTSQPWNKRLIELETIKMTLVRPSMTNLEMTVRADCAVSACSPLPLSIKVLAHWLSVGWSQLWTDGDALTSICCLVAKRVTLCDPMDCSLPDSSVHGIFQARILGWVAISFCKESFWGRDWTHTSCIDGWILGRFFTTEPPWKSPTPFPSTIPGIQNKANFPFHQHDLFNGFWAGSSQTLVTGTSIKSSLNFSSGLLLISID